MPLLAKINPGRMDRKVSLRAPVAVRGLAGGFLNAWVEQLAPWAEFVPNGGGERRGGGVIQEELAGTFTMRWVAALAPEWRIVADGRTFEVVSVNEIGRRQYLAAVVRSLSSTAQGVNDVLQAFTVNLSADAVAASVSFPTPFSGVPRGLKVQLVVPADGFSFGADVVDGTVTASGFSVALGAAVPGAGYKLSIIAVK
jgi:head-tail adaptor